VLKVDPDERAEYRRIKLDLATAGGLTPFTNFGRKPADLAVFPP
jgi:hypothetical protein